MDTKDLTVYQMGTIVHRKMKLLWVSLKAELLNGMSYKVKKSCKKPSTSLVYLIFSNPIIKPVNSKGNQPRILTARTDAETEPPLFWPPDRKS